MQVRDVAAPATLRAAFLVALFAAGCASSTPHAPARPSPTPEASATADKFYMLARLDLQDFERFRTEYAPNVMPMLMRAGARVLVASPTVEIREGAWDANWTVVLEFPSRTAAMAFYESAEYQPFKQLRTSLVRSQSLLFVGGFTLPPGASSPAGGAK